MTPVMHLLAAATPVLHLNLCTHLLLKNAHSKACADPSLRHALTGVKCSLTITLPCSEEVFPASSIRDSWQPSTRSQVCAARLLPSSSLTWLTLLCAVLDLLPVVHLIVVHLPSGADRRALRATCRQLRKSAAILDTFVWFTAASPMTLQPCDLPFLDSLSRLSQLCITHAPDHYEQMELLGHQCPLRSLLPLLALPGLTSIESSCYHNSADIALLSCAKSLLELAVHCCNFEGDLELSPSLTKLKLDEITSTAGLCQLVGLKDLDLGFTHRLRQLSALQQLTRLCLGPSMARSLRASDLQGLTSLRVLELCRIRNDEQLPQLSQLKGLYLEEVLAPRLDLRGLTNLLHLGLKLCSQHISISSPSITSIFLDAGCRNDNCDWPDLVQCIQLKRIFLHPHLSGMMHVPADRLPPGPLILSVPHQHENVVVAGSCQVQHQAVKQVSFMCDPDILQSE